MSDKLKEGASSQQTALSDQQMPLLGAVKSDSEVQTPSATDQRMEKENREELGRFVQSACQLAEQPNLRDGFYTSPEETHSKHHLDMHDVECHHRSDEYAHAYHPISPRRKLAHSRSTKDNRSHGKSKSKKSSGQKEQKGVHDAVSAPNLQDHPKGKDGEVSGGDTTDHADGASHESTQDAVGFYIGEGLNNSPATMGVRRGYAEEPPGASEETKSEESKPKVTFHLGSNDGMPDLETPPSGSPVTGSVSSLSCPPSWGDIPWIEGGTSHRHRRYRRRHVSKDDLPYWQHLGSNVELDRITPVTRNESDEVTALADGDLENIASHRYGNTWGTRKRKLSYTSSIKMKTRQSNLPRVAVDRNPHEMFVELDELVWDDTIGWEWREKARWIKFEEDLDEGAERWGKPHVASLSFHSLLELRRCIEQGALLLDLEATCMTEITQRIIDQLIITDQLDPRHRDDMLHALLSRHQHVGEKNIPIPRNKTYFNLYGLDKMARNADNTQDHDGKKFPDTVDMGQEGPQTNVQIDDVEKEKNKLYVLPPGVLPGHQSRPEAAILRKIPPNAEACMVLAGNVDFLSKPVMAFVRLCEGQCLSEILEVPLPVRFLFLVMGPTNTTVDCHEVGRSISTLMSNPYFLDDSYKAEDRQDLLDAINRFLDNAIVLPPCEWDKKTLLPILLMAKETLRRKKTRRLSLATLHGSPSLTDLEPLARTGRLFGGMVKDVKRRYPQYLSDIKDGLNFHCFATFFFIYFACLSPAVTFGGLLSDKTDKWLGVCEMLVMTSVGGVMFSLLAAQPLTIVGATGPLLLFEESLYVICGQVGLEYMPMRLWINLWVGIFTVFVVMFEGSFLVQYFTRFTEEIFSALIALIFIYEVFYKLVKVFLKHPLNAFYPLPNISSNGLSNVTYNVTSTPYDVEVHSQPNTALLTLILTLGTYFIAEYLKKFRNSKFLGRSIRRALGDFGVPIAIAIMVAVDYSIAETYTEKLDVPNGLKPTASEKRGWVIHPLGMKERLPMWAIFGASIPALLLFIIVFMEMQITSKIINKTERKLKKGSGYHLDLMLVGVLISVGGVFGLPLVTGAAVRSVTHVSALSVYTHKQAPGMKPVLSMVREQRVTGLAVHVMIGVSAMLGQVLRNIPLAVLFGIFLYMGLSVTAGIQLFERMQLFFVPAKHHPMVSYIRQVPTRKIHMYTLVQVILLTAMWAIKSSSASLAFPFALILTVPIRKFLLPLVFTETELRELDSDLPPEQLDSDQDEPDFYEQVPMPV